MLDRSSLGASQPVGACDEGAFQRLSLLVCCAIKGSKVGDLREGPIGMTLSLRKVADAHTLRSKSTSPLLTIKAHN